MAKKPKPRNKEPSKKYSKYKINGNTIERAPTCPKCGAGTFLAVHKDRKTCGKCSYSIFGNK